MMIKEATEKIMRFENLSINEAYQVMKYIMDGNANDCQISAFLTALKMKGESIEEISGFSKVMLEKADKLNISFENVVDTCGTGGDNKNTFNISTTAAFIAAGAGVLVAKHGNRSVSSKSGSADVLEALGVNINLNSSQIEYCINNIGIGFIFAPKAHKAMMNVANVRKEIGIKTVFNILGPITNPAMASGRVLGVFDKKLIDIMIYSLKNLGVKKAFVVYGCDGMDEFSVCSSNYVAELSNEKVNKYLLNPCDLGFKRYKLKELQGGDAKENASILMNILTGKEKGAKRDSAILNSAAAITVSGKVDNLKDALDIAIASIDSGSALEKLKKLIDFTNNFN